MSEKSASVLWSGAGKKGLGKISTESGALKDYLYRILTAQGMNAPGGAKSYIKNGRMTDGYALVAWPAKFDDTGVMTFIVNQDGVVYEKSLGPHTAAIARAMRTYDPDSSWQKAQPVK